MFWSCKVQCCNLCPWDASLCNRNDSYNIIIVQFHGSGKLWINKGYPCMPGVGQNIGLHPLALPSSKKFAFVVLPFWFHNTPPTLPHVLTESPSMGIVHTENMWSPLQRCVNLQVVSFLTSQLIQLHFFTILFRHEVFSDMTSEKDFTCDFITCASPWCDIHGWLGIVIISTIMILRVDWAFNINS